MARSLWPLGAAPASRPMQWAFPLIGLLALLGLLLMALAQASCGLGSVPTGPTDAATYALPPSPSPPPTEGSPAPTGPPAPAATSTPIPSPSLPSEGSPTPTEQPAPATSPAAPPSAATLPPLPVKPEEAREAIIGGRTFILEIAISPEERIQGLSNRDHLPPDAGMLFIFAEESVLAFWMKDTLIPLDILFLDQDRRIVNIHTMTPQPGTPTDRLTVYRSAAPAMYAVEVNAGAAAELGLAPGMVVEFR